MGVWEAEDRWRLVEEVRIGAVDGEGPDVWGSVVDVVPDGAGRLWVADNHAFEIRVFSPGGRWIRTVGNEGRGPGEIGLTVALLRSPHGRIWVHDGRNQRFTVYDTTGSFVRSHPIRSTRFLQGHRFGNAGRLLQLVALGDGVETGVVLVRDRVAVDGTLVPVDTVPAPELPSTETVLLRFRQGELEAIRAAAIPFVPQPDRIVDPRGFVWTTAVDGSYLLRRHGEDGRVVGTVGRDYAPVAVAPEERARALEPFRDADLDPDRVPDVHPPFESVAVARSGHLWVWRHAEPGRMAWDVFDPAGAYLGRVDPPWNDGRFRLLALEEDLLYGVWRGALDVSYVIRLRIVRPAG